MSQVPATQQELNKFVQVIDEFKAKYARLRSPEFRADVYATKNASLISDYETTLSRSATLDKSINAMVGAWDAFKRGYASVTDKTSMWIGDAIDTVRGWFGGGPNVHVDGLGAIQVPAAVGVAAAVSAAMILIAAMNRIFVSVEASKLQRENPSMSREVALGRAKGALPSLLPAGIGLGTIALGALALWLVLGGKKR